MIEIIGTLPGGSDREYNGSSVFSYGSLSLGYPNNSFGLPNWPSNRPITNSDILTVVKSQARQKVKPANRSVRLIESNNQ